MKHLIFLPLLAAVCQAQAPSDLVSPEVQTDRKATFRIYAPKATEVTLNGDWEPKGFKGKMTRDDRGVWSLTVGPLAPQIYLYSFTVDGMNIADPINPRMKLRARTSASLMEIPGNELWQFRDVPHGTVEINLHKSAVLGGVPRQVFVYTPPDYGRNPKARYPVLYLLHGNNDVAAGWTFTGNAHFILDNLLAEKKAVPMLIVMPWAHAVPFDAPKEVLATNTEMFRRYLLEEVIPLVDAKYRTVPTAAKRAVAGLSMGGSQSMHISFRHPEVIASAGIFSAAVRDAEKAFPTLFADPKLTNTRMKLLWIGLGKEDALLPAVTALRATLDKHGIRYTYFETDGGHYYPEWRKMLAEFAPRLFR